MDILSILGYVNKFSLVAFVITVLILGFQIYQFKTDSKKNTKAPEVPDFNDKASVPTLNYTRLNLVAEPKKTFTKSSFDQSLVVLIALTILVVIVLVLSLIIRKNTSISQVPPSPQVQLVSSSGIKVYGPTGQEMTQSEESSLQPGDNITIGIVKTNDPNIDMARIKLNEASWSAADITTAFDNSKNIYYKEFTIASDESSLRIDAELHSKKDGWLGN